MCSTSLDNVHGSVGSVPFNSGEIVTDAPDATGNDHAERHSASLERRDYNDLSPIGKLPEDILLNIFMLYLEVSRWNSPYCQVTYTTFTSRYGWNDSEVIVCEKRRLTGFEV